MSYSCPTCGVEFEDVNAFLSHQRAALERMRDRSRRERLEAERWDMMRQHPDSGLEPPSSPPPWWGGGDPATEFLRRYSGKG